MARKPATKLSQTHGSSHAAHSRLVFYLTIVVACMGLTLLIAIPFTRFHRPVPDDPTIIKQLILQSTANSNFDAPIDPRSGDIYFPDAKLYLPVVPGSPRYTYHYQADGDILSISTRQAYGRAAAQLTQQTTTTSVFDTVPRLQACSRGIAVTTKPTSDTSLGTLRQTINLVNGRKRYVYLEMACPYLDDAANSLRNLRTY